jgi:hypothetical protein
VSDSVAGTLPPTSPPTTTGAEPAFGEVCVLVRIGKSSVWSIVPMTSAARGPEAKTGTVEPVWDWLPETGAVP